MNRRSFFKSLLGAAAFLAAPKLPALEPAPKKYEHLKYGHTFHFYPYMNRETGDIELGPAFPGQVWYLGDPELEVKPFHYNCRCIIQGED